jgi:hypothetical protein
MTADALPSVACRAVTVTDPGDPVSVASAAAAVPIAPPWSNDLRVNDGFCTEAHYVVRRTRAPQGNRKAQDPAVPKMSDPRYSFERVSQTARHCREPVFD